MSDKTTADNGIDIEIENDAPLEDQGRPRRPEGETASIPEDDEIATYAVSAQTRIKKLRYDFHEERRAREESDRQNKEAIRLVKHLKDELQRTRGFARHRDKEALDGARHGIEAQIAAARKDLEDAFTTGDTTKYGEANEKLARLAAQSERLRITQPSMPSDEVLEQSERQITIPEDLPNPPPPDEKARGWAERNPWFGVDKTLTGLAYGVHAEILDEKRIAIGSDEYYKAIDDGLRKVAPDAFGRRSNRSESEGRATSAPSGVSSAGRSSPSAGGRRTIRITQSQADIAKKLGITNEQYVAELIKLGDDY